MPRLNCRAMAEMLTLPGSAQFKLLSEQKHPKSGAQAFRVPYYHPALSAIRGYYATGNDSKALIEARKDIGQISVETRRNHNLRVLASFESGDKSGRQLEIKPNQKVTVTLGKVEIRLSPDMRATEDDKPACSFTISAQLKPTPISRAKFSK